MNLYLFNVGFEDELVGNTNTNPIALQLQFLPFHLATQEDVVIVSHEPYTPWKSEVSYQLLHTPNTFEKASLYPWGITPTLRKFCLEKNISIELPSHESVITANSKTFSFSLGEKLKGATIITKPEQALEFISTMTLPCIFKSDLGYSGFGKKIVQKKEQIPALLSWIEGKKVLAEPFVERLLDFSMHFTLQKDRSYSFLGFTKMLNTPSGAYEKSYVGKEDLLFGKYLDHALEAKKRSESVLRALASTSYFGPVGIDAMLYIEPKTSQIKLQHCLEINARMTMGRYALLLKQKLAPNSALSSLFVASRADNALPLVPKDVLLPNGEKLTFSKTLFFKI